MSTISIRREHGLTQRQAVAVAKKMAIELEEEYGINASWVSNDMVDVSGMGVSGTLQLPPHRLTIDLRLGLMAMMFREKIRSGIESRLDDLLVSPAPKRKQGTKK